MFHLALARKAHAPYRRQMGYGLADGSAYPLIPTRMAAELMTAEATTPLRA